MIVVLREVSYRSLGVSHLCVRVCVCVHPHTCVLALEDDWYQYVKVIKTHLVVFYAIFFFFYSWLWFITVRGYRIKSAKRKSTRARVQESSKCEASSGLLHVQSREAPLSWHQCMITCMEYCQSQLPIESLCLEFLFGFRHLGRVD